MTDDILPYVADVCSSNYVDCMYISHFPV